jgi:hypothetical protein
VKSAPTSQSARFITRRQRRGYLRANRLGGFNQPVHIPYGWELRSARCSDPVYGVVPHFPDFLQNGQELWRWRGVAFHVTVYPARPFSHGRGRVFSARLRASVSTRSNNLLSYGRSYDRRND